MTSVRNIVRDHAKKLKYAAVIVAILMITVDANAEWNLSKQVGDGGCQEVCVHYVLKESKEILLL